MHFDQRSQSSLFLSNSEFSRIEEARLSFRATIIQNPYDASQTTAMQSYWLGAAYSASKEELARCNLLVRWQEKIISISAPRRANSRTDLALFVRSVQF